RRHSCWPPSRRARPTRAGRPLPVAGRSPRQRPRLAPPRTRAGARPEPADCRRSASRSGSLLLRRTYVPACPFGHRPPTRLLACSACWSWLSSRGRYSEPVQQRVSLITLGVSDLARARRFYTALGWKPATSPADDVVFFQAGGMILGLWDRTMLANDSAVEDAGGWGGVAPAHNATAAAAGWGPSSEGQPHGARTGRDPAATFWGGYSGLFIDPDGHPWEVAHNPGWTLLADGSVRLPE